MKSSADCLMNPVTPFFKLFLKMHLHLTPGDCTKPPRQLLQSLEICRGGALPQLICSNFFIPMVRGCRGFMSLITKKAVVAVEGLLFVGAAEAASLTSLCWDEGENLLKSPFLLVL